MFERRFNAIAFRDFMVAICLTLVAGCNAAVDSTAPEAPVDGALPAPTGLVAMPGSAQANLSWSASNGATRYLVKRSTTSGGPYGQVATAMSPAYTDATVSNGATYYYVIAAANADSMSADSAQAAVTLAAGAVAPPPAPTGLGASSGISEASLTWSASAGATRYSVKRATTSGGPYMQVATPTSTSYSDVSVTNGTAYYYVVSALNSGGESANSAEASATPVAPGVLPAVACSNLGAPGTWTNVTPPGYNADYRPAAFVIDRNTGIVYLGTDSYNDGHSKGIQRSVDCGKTWIHVSTGSGSDAINGGREWTFRINHVDGRIMYTNSGYYSLGLWKSYNGGVDWTDVTPKVDGAPGFVGDLQIDPDDPEHLLVTWHGPCNGLHNEFKYEDGVGCFHETKDGGRTWKGLYSSSTKWPSQVRVLLLHGSTWIVLSDSALRTTDGGKNFTPVFGGSLGGHSSGTLSRTNNGAFFVGTQFGAYLSTAESDGRDWTAVGGQWVGGIADTGSLLYMTQMVTVLRSSPSGDGVTWQDVAGSPSSGCESTNYDALHKALYVSCGVAGLWRLVVN